jgi:hypothetical protein
MGEVQNNAPATGRDPAGGGYIADSRAQVNRIDQQADR